VSLKFLVTEAGKKARLSPWWFLLFLSISELALTLYLVFYAVSLLSVTGYCMNQLHVRMPELFNASLVTIVSYDIYLHSYDWTARTYTLQEIVSGIKPNYSLPDIVTERWT
jgi:hypothetical protein